VDRGIRERQNVEASAWRKEGTDAWGWLSTYKSVVGGSLNSVLWVECVGLEESCFKINLGMTPYRAVG
jgi:hypothetical protein